MHSCLILWENGDTKTLRELLLVNGFGVRESYWKFCQAVAESLPPGNKEKQLLEGFLIGRERYSDYSQRKNESEKLTYYLDRKEE